jgi:hypothetical protein
MAAMKIVEFWNAKIGFKKAIVMLALAGFLVWGLMAVNRNYIVSGRVDGAEGWPLKFYNYRGFNQCPPGPFGCTQEQHFIWSSLAIDYIFWLAISFLLVAYFEKILALSWKKVILTVLLLISATFIQGKFWQPAEKQSRGFPWHFVYYTRHCTDGGCKFLGLDTISIFNLPKDVIFWYVFSGVFIFGTENTLRLIKKRKNASIQIAN